VPRRVPLRAAESLEFEAIAGCTGVALIRVKKVCWPVLLVFAIVTVRPSKLELKRPSTGDEQVCHLFRDYAAAVQWMLTEMLGDGTNELRLAIWTDTAPEILERNTLGVDHDQRVGDVRD
jgi:hypothetical protein